MQYVFKNVVSMIKIFRKGISFSKNDGFRNCPCAKSQLGTSLFKTSVLFIECNDPDHEKCFYFRFSLSY